MKSLSTLHDTWDKQHWQVNFEMNNVVLWQGVPGKKAGHVVSDASSYFDRLWKRSQLSERYFIVLTKQVSSTLKTSVQPAGKKMYFASIEADDEKKENKVTETVNDDEATAAADDDDDDKPQEDSNIISTELQQENAVNVVKKVEPKQTTKSQYERKDKSANNKRKFEKEGGKYNNNKKPFGNKFNKKGSDNQPAYKKKKY